MEDWSFCYDDEVDVMYITFGNHKPCISYELIPNMLFRYDIDRNLNGITIIGFLY